MKVASLLAKRKIENFCPLNSKETSFTRRKKIVYVPLFSSYVFVNTPETELEQFKHIKYIVSLVYWKGQPAKVSEDEINSIKEFSLNYQGIKLIRSKVVENDVVIVNGPSYSIDGNVLSVKNKIMKKNLPSLGFIMKAEIQTDSLMGREISFGNKDLALQ